MECSHLLDNVKLDSDLFGEGTSITKNFDCSECSIKEQNWLCLQCGVINCGRYANGHAKLHAETLNHQLCMSCDAYSVYCYKCDDYVSNEVDIQTIDKIRQSIIKIRDKENTEPNSNVEEIENIDKHEEPSPLSNELVLSNKLVLSPIMKESPVSPNMEPGVSEPANIEAGASEITECKTSKLNKSTEEPVRSLRPRSRKRSHSAENNTENTMKSKAKKSSPCNGKTQREKKIVGLKNLGNTCFMNAVLQSLNNIQEFSCYFSQLPSLEMKNNGRKVYHSRSYTRQEMHDVVMAEELRKVLINLNTGGCGSKAAISPECLFLVIWKVVPRFRGYQQQDAHEFLRYMLDRLHTELLQLLPPDRAEGGFVPRAPSSIVTAVFGGTLQSEMCIRMWLEVGHACEPRQSVTGRALALDWRVWVRGARGDISSFVQKVVFKLHPPSAFVYPKRVRQEPPYEIQESGCASMNIPIQVYLKFPNKPKKICLRYNLHIENNNKATSASRCVYYDFENPSATLCSALMKGGGEVIAHTTKSETNKLVVLFENKPKDLKPRKLRKYRYIEPIRCKHGTKPCLIEDICTKCGETTSQDLRHQLRSVKMTEDEINRVSQLYLSYKSYEKSVDSLILPPISDPIYRVPELPASLRSALVSVEADYAMQ